MSAHNRWLHGAIAAQFIQRNLQKQADMDQAINDHTGTCTMSTDMTIRIVTERQPKVSSFHITGSDEVTSGIIGEAPFIETVCEAWALPVDRFAIMGPSAVCCKARSVARDESSPLFRADAIEPSPCRFKVASTAVYGGQSRSTRRRSGSTDRVGDEWSVLVLLDRPIRWRSIRGARYRRQPLSSCLLKDSIVRLQANRCLRHRGW